MRETRMKSGETNFNRLKTLVSAVPEKGSGSYPEKLSFGWTKFRGAGQPRCQSSVPTYMMNEESNLDWLNKTMRTKGLLKEKGIA